MIEALGFLGIPVRDPDAAQAFYFADPDGDELMLHRRYAPYPDS